MAITAFTEEDSHHSQLAQKIRSQILHSGAMPFREFMALALYDPDSGYYSGDKQRVGKQGDFITSVSVGRCFGLILARRLARYWKEIGQPKSFHIIEPGAHDGALCLDILTELQQSFPEFAQTVCYHLVERSEKLRSLQKSKLEDLQSGMFEIHSDISPIKAVTGAIISNELLDAIPVDLIRWNQGKWHTLGVTTHPELVFDFTPLPIPSTDQALTQFCQQLSRNTSFPEGYTTEYQPELQSFSATAAATLQQGLFITIDYGHHAEDYYHPDRIEGTLQTYHAHQKSTRPLLTPGEIDITSHVDFTRLSNEAEAAGFSNPSLSTQASYLTNQARDWLLEIEQAPTPEVPALLRQFQTLIHPSMLGSSFMVLEMEK